jgi:putative glutamine amidotransferase
MPKPIIVVSAGRRRYAAKFNELQTTVTAVDMDYIDSVADAGGAPVVLPCVPDPDVIASIMSHAAGFILTGGGDICALRYGEDPHSRSTLYDPVRDAMEIEAFRVARKLRLPILGICRGQQLVNVALGGTLVQDIGTQLHTSNQHFAAPVDVVLLHQIEIEPASLLAKILGTTSTAVNSFHHQAVKDLGEGLSVSARSRDGVIEAIESPLEDRTLAVQFHPEEISRPYPLFARLFTWLVDEAR